MSFSVTENVSSVTDVMALLSSLGFEGSPGGTRLELVIDSYDHWSNPANALLAPSSASGLVTGEVAA